MPKVSVIIPVYNVEKYLEQCLDSVVNQTLEDIEIICVDDGSTDKSLEILKTYAQKDSRIKILTQQNQFAGVARNKGLEIATGEYLYFMDSDDFISNELVEKMFHKIKKYDADICVCLNNIFDNNTQEYKKCFWAKDIELTKNLEVFNKNNIPQDLFQFCNIPAYTKLYKASFVKANETKFQATKTCNDVFFNLYSLAMAEKIVVLPEELSTYRQGHSNLTKNRGKHINCILEAFSKLRNELKKQNLFNLLSDTMYKRARASFNYEICQLGNQKEKDYWTLKLYKFLPKEYWTKRVLKLKKENSIIRKIFSIQNIYIHKVICIFGIKFKIKSKKLVERQISKNRNLPKPKEGV